MFDLDYRLDPAEHAARQEAVRGIPCPVRAMSISINGEITRELADDICASLENAPAVEEITASIDSEGGNFTAAFDLFVTMHHHPAGRKVAHILRAESAALLVALGCDHRIARSTAPILLHPVRHMDPGVITARRAAELADCLSWADRQFSEILAYRTGRPAELFLTEDERSASLDWCLKTGLIHGVAYHG